MDRGANIMMVRGNLDTVPDCALPAGYSVRPYEPGDGATWTWIWTAASLYNEIAAETFVREFGTDEDVLRERQSFLCEPGGEAVGTATAWFGKEEIDAGAGLVHWVAVVPHLQGKGLGGSLMAIVLQRLRELGYGRSYLITQTARVAAIRLYLSFGFVPGIRSEKDRLAWSGLRDKLPEGAIDGFVGAS